MSKLLFALHLCLLSFAANCFALVQWEPWFLAAAIPAFLTVNVLCGFFDSSLTVKRLKVLRHGAFCLWLFLFSAVISAWYHIGLAFYLLPGRFGDLLLSILVCVCVEAVIFWNGIICVYCTCCKIGIRYRVIGIVCGMIPIANLVALSLILRKASQELTQERARLEKNRDRADKALCATRYPLLLVHGVFFRDSKYFNYWGRIPEELEQNGARVYYGDHQSAAAVADSARELTDRIKAIVSQTGCEKVNIIAHSKGGLDCRYAIARLDAAPYIASLTTVNTPHRGCLFADDLLDKIPQKVQNKVSSTYNRVLRKLGDPNPDFMAAVKDLTASACRQFDALPQPEGIYCQSIGSVMKHAGGGTFPLNFSYHLVRHFDGPNDGLVAESAFSWGERYILLQTQEDRGISHCDVIDLTREDLEDFDVREFYVQLVSELKEKGL